MNTSDIHSVWCRVSVVAGVLGILFLVLAVFCPSPALANDAGDLLDTANASLRKYALTTMVTGNDVQGTLVNKQRVLR